MRLLPGMSEKEGREQMGLLPLHPLGVLFFQTSDLNFVARWGGGYYTASLAELGIDCGRSQPQELSFIGASLYIPICLDA